MQGEFILREWDLLHCKNSSIQNSREVSAGSEQLLRIGVLIWHEILTKDWGGKRTRKIRRGRNATNAISLRVAVDFE